jgi:hypothetical protein
MLYKKMNRLFVSKIVFLFSYLFLVSSTYSTDDFGGRWSETLNFTHQHLNMKTDPQGNVTILTDNLKSEPLDVETIHTNLAKLANEVTGITGESHNIVIAGLSIIFKVGDNYEAIYSHFEEVGSKIIAFISGSVEKKGQKSKKFTFIGPSEAHPPEKLLRKFKERLEKNTEKEKGKAEAESEETNFSSELSTSCIKNYYNKWTEDKQKVLLETKENLSKSLSQESDLTLLYVLKAQINEAIKNNNSVYGSSIDSEQFLLNYLEQEEDSLTDDDFKSNICTKYLSLMAKYKIEKLEQLKSNFEVQSLHNSDQLIEEFREKINQLKEMKEVGCILNLHSTNEICCCCAYSLAKELRHGTNFSKIKEIIGCHDLSKDNSPSFFAILTSSNKYVRGSGGSRPGIGLESSFTADDYNDENLIRIESLTEKGVFLQKFLGKETASLLPTTHMRYSTEEELNIAKIHDIFLKNPDASFGPSALQSLLSSKFSIAIETRNLRSLLKKLEENKILRSAGSGNYKLI